MTVEVSTPKSFIRYLKRLKNPQKQNASIEAIARFINSPRDPKLNFERVVGRPGTFQFGLIMKPAFCCDQLKRIANMTRWQWAIMIWSMKAISGVECEVVHLAPADQQALAEALADPPEPAPALWRARKAHRRLIAGTRGD